jgi:hypothetical protein
MNLEELGNLGEFIAAIATDLSPKLTPHLG